MIKILRGKLANSAKYIHRKLGNFSKNIKRISQWRNIPSLWIGRLYHKYVSSLHSDLHMYWKSINSKKKSQRWGAWVA